jgi:hypothetical protein
MRSSSCMTAGDRGPAAGILPGLKKNGNWRRNCPRKTKIRNIALFFKQVDPRQLRDPGQQLKKVIEFKKQIEARRRYLFKTYAKTDDFCGELEKHLAKWLRDHKGAATSPSLGGLGVITPPDKKTDATPPATTHSLILASIIGLQKRRNCSRPSLPRPGITPAPCSVRNGPLRRPAQTSNGLGRKICWARPTFIRTDSPNLLPPSRKLWSDLLSRAT